MLTIQEGPSSLKKSYKFIRRADITSELRMKLGVLLVCFNYQLSAEQLNVIRFYLNHRVYKRGKRKGFAPIELLSDKKLTSLGLICF